MEVLIPLLVFISNYLPSFGCVFTHGFLCGSVQDTCVPSLGQEDPLEEGMATNSSILAWRIPWTEEPGGLQSMGLQESDMT